MGIISKTIALTPATGGGYCIDGSALQMADIIVSATTEFVSGLIRIGTWSDVSHAALYAGGDIVIEAGKHGVTNSNLYNTVAHDVLAVAYRHSAMPPTIAASIDAYAQKQVGQQYSYLGVICVADSILCRTAGLLTQGFFCSKLVAEAYRQGGLPLFDVPASCVTPEQVVETAQLSLVYVGHIKGDPTLFPVFEPS